MAHPLAGRGACAMTGGVPSQRPTVSAAMTERRIMVTAGAGKEIKGSALLNAEAFNNADPLIVTAAVVRVNNRGHPR